MSTERNYNGVTVEKSWTLRAFVQQHGKPKFTSNVNKETGEMFHSLAFNGDDGNTLFCHFGYSCEGMTPDDIIAAKDDIKIGLNSNGKYTVYRQDNAWTTIDVEW